MRHRRRLSTQTVQRRKTSQIRPARAPREPNRFIALLKYILILGFIVLVIYAGYKYLVPEIRQKLPALTLFSKAQPEITKDVEQPSLPVEEPVETATNETQPEIFVKATQIEILNGCGEQGIAKYLADKLKAFNYDVVNTGNYLRNGKPYFSVKKTRLIDQVNSDETKQKTLDLAKIMGIPSEQIESFSNPNPIADITIIIGQDYKTLSIFKGKE